MKLLILLLAGLAPAFAQTTATLTVTADGTQPFTYTWKKDGAALPGATSKDLVLSPLASSMNGVYLAQVSNSAGVATTPPTNLVVLTSSAAAVDLSKRSAEMVLAASPWSPPVAQFPQFAIVPLKTILDPGSHFNPTTGIYTVGAGEGGIYVTEITIRVQDQPPYDDSIGITAGLNNLDDHTLWTITPGKPIDPATYVRFGATHKITRQLAAGAQIRCNLFVQSAIQILSYDVTIWQKN